MCAHPTSRPCPATTPLSKYGTSSGTGGALTFNWASGGPDPSISSTPFSVRWTGLLRVPAGGGSYTFTANDSDGTRLRIGNALVIDDWNAHGGVPNPPPSGTVTLPGGPVRVSCEVFATSAPAQAQLSWSGPGITGTQLIPTSALTTEKWVTSRSIYDGGLQGLKAAYFGTTTAGNTSLAGRPTILETDLTGTGSGVSTGATTFDMNWNGSAPAAGVPATNWSARWSGLLAAPQSGIYHFLGIADDDVRVYIDGTLVVDNWPTGGQGFSTSPPPPAAYSDAILPSGVSLTQGTHTIMVEYAQLTGGSRLQVSWLTPGASGYAVIPASTLQPNYGLVTSTVDPAGTTTTNSYSGGSLDPVRGLETDKTVVNKDHDGILTTYTTHTTYDAYGRVLTTTSPKGMTGGGSPDPNYTRTYHYDTGTGATAGLLLAEDIPGQGGTGAVQYTSYEAPQAGFTYSSGRLLQKVDQRGTWVYTYDADGRQTSETPPGRTAPSQATVTDYDANGNVIDVYGPDGAVGMTYDALDRMAATKTYATLTRAPLSTDTPDQVSSTLSFDAEGKPLTTDDQANGTGGVVTYGYDSLGRNTTITDPGSRQVTFTYDPTTGRLTDTNLPNGTKIHQDYDPASGRVVNLTNHKTGTPSDTVIADYRNAQYSLTGQLTGVASPDGQYAYTYDTVGRLETWTDPTGAVHRYRFDLNSNRTEQDLNGTATHTYQYQADTSDRLASVDSGMAYGYNGAGDVTSRPGQTLTQDPFGRVSKVTNTVDGSYVQYVYDSLHRVRERQQYGAGGTPKVSDVLYYFDGTGDQPSWEKETAGPNAGAVKSYLDGVAVEYAGTRSTGAPTYLYSDIHGNTVATADANGNRTAGPFTYDPFGVSTTPTGNGTNPTSFGFVGKFAKYTDAAAGGLVLMGVRPYDPALGRFLAVDPVEHGSANDYDYAAQDPVNQNDLTGMFLGRFGNWWADRAHDVKRAVKRAAPHVVLSYGGCMIACAFLTFQGGHFGLNVGAWGILDRGVAVGWANKPVQERGTTSVAVGGGALVNSCGKSSRA